MAYHKHSHVGFFGKGLGNKLLGAAKFAGSVLDDPLAQGAITALAPEIGAGLAAAKKLGILEKIKHA